jgi:hypothetical protein
MEARIVRAALLAAIVSLAFTQLVFAAGYRTTNFVVTAGTPEIAKAVGDLAELYRRDLSIEWLGHELPQWTQPCPITVQVAPNLGAGGATSFMFDRGRPFGWQMSIQGSYERVLDSVLPHEVTHTIFATHFGQPLPRWADEGACTTVEHESEKDKQHHNLIRFLQTQRGIAFNKMFRMREYPPDVLPLYAQGYSVTRYLIAQRGKRHFVDYVGEGLKTNNWPEATRKFYGYQDLSDLQVKWLAWVAAGSPPIQPAGEGATTLASADGKYGAVVRGQDGGHDHDASQEAMPADYAEGESELPWRTRGPSTSLAANETITAAPQAMAGDTSAQTGVIEQSVTRPQPPQQAGQTVLEWSRPPQPLPQTAVRPEPLPGRSYYDRSAGGRMLR